MAHPSVVINGVTYPNVPSVAIPVADGGGVKANFYDASNTDALNSDIVNGRKVVTAMGEITGSMPENGSGSATITTRDQQVNLSAGHYTGGTIEISSAERAKIIPANIKSGVTILGQPGAMSAASISQDSTTKVLTIS